MTSLEWQTAPAEHELANYDEPKIRYRNYVERIVSALGPTGIRNKTFFTISTNVSCADVSTSDNSIDSISRDIYLPLEIAITKWSLSKSGPPKWEHPTKLWMINPGPLPRGCRNIAIEHQKERHKIDFDPDDIRPNSHYEVDINKVMKEINGFLNPDRTVYSLSLRNVRQDLGSIKWLNRETGYKTKPIQVYSLEDLYVVLTRHLCPNFGSVVCLGIASHRMTNYDGHDPQYQCDYHKLITKIDNSGSNCCASALAQGYTDILIKDILDYISLEESTKATKEGGKSLAKSKGATIESCKGKKAFVISAAKTVPA